MRRLSQIRAIIYRRYCTKEEKWPRQIFSAIQPTGVVHLGNYLGAVKSWVHLQNTEKNKVVFAIADLHSLTLPQDPGQLHDNIYTMAASLLACGIDTNKCIFFQQSAISQHAELSWILGTLTTMPRLAHLPQFKEKSESVKHVSVGIFLYPILQAADIMLYRATHVPVGKDQIQQVEFVNHLVKIFNNRFGHTFPNADIITEKTLSRVRSLTDPTKKMSKSDTTKKSTINLMDSPDEILFKCKRALTDFTSEVTFKPEARLGVSNLILIHSGLTGKTPEQIVQESAGLNTGEYKILLAEVIIEHLKPIKQKIYEYLDSRDYLAAELEKGANQARMIAEATLDEVKRKVGLDLLSLKSSLSKNLKRAL